ncbi:PREDICTED: epithelial cell-transforming sequence 2 oncogene-like [Branchiostoma belcheri]|uniref:Epithelial cell-transforming sequence 2 oncogene-like n=1 Tax=Branchiostoma belcheri TaxID=7741 RepID=A0A6P5ADJ7_BRABE|nr:PREDICTED: epithelial cell-transforming sequence 2 oncogene-like [Branchiostoma belcheri]
MSSHWRRSMGARTPSPPGKKTAKVTPTRRPSSAMSWGGRPSSPMRKSPTPRDHVGYKPKSVILQPDAYTTDRMMTLKSAYTPIVHRPSNHTFDVWTDAQRKKFLATILLKCTRGQLMFIRDWFVQEVPVERIDFTTVLPKFLSIYIFSFLDPRSMCRAAGVSWHWKFLTEQDSLWIPKCVKYGWFLPYTPSEREYGCWKYHYIACTKTLDTVVKNKPSDNYNSFGFGVSEDAREREIQKDNEKAKRRKTRKYQPSGGNFKEKVSIRPPWAPTDPKPREYEEAYKAFLAEYNPNDPDRATKATLYTDKFGIPRHSRSKTAPSKFEYGLQSSWRKQRHRAVTSGEELDLRRESQAVTLTESVQMENYNDTGGSIEQDWEPPRAREMHKSLFRKDLSGGGPYPAVYKGGTDLVPLGRNYPSHDNPRVIFISSSIPAAEVLVDAVLFGCIPIVYEFEGTTLVSLYERLEEALQGRHAKSIGLFIDGEPGEANLVKGHTLKLQSLVRPDIREFFERLCNNTMAPNLGGHVDLFLPLASTDAGMEVILQMGILTGMQFSSPTGIVGQYGHVQSEWLATPEHAPPPTLYFNMDKLLAWASMADLVQEALRVTHKLLRTYFSNAHRDLCSQLTGQLVFDVLDLGDLKRFQDVIYTIRDGLVAMQVDEITKPLEFLGRYLLDCASTVALQDHPDKRTQVAHELLSSEVRYCKILQAMRDVFVIPLRNALSSNKAIISAPNIQDIFGNALQLLELSKELVEDVKGRILEWGPHQCLGDVFFKFTIKLKAYSNYFNNYEQSLRCIEKCIEQTPGFRTYVRRYSQTPQMKMLSLQEVLLAPTRRITEYITLLWELHHKTTPDHPDREDITSAIANFRKLEEYVKELKVKSERDRRLIALQKRILRCPMLLEANRFLIREEVFAHLLPAKDEVQPELRIYHHIQNLGFFLFNDALVVTVFTTKHFPFERCVQENHNFFASISLNRIQVSDIADSKFVKNAFKMVTPKRKFICAAETYELKFSWITALQDAIQAAIELE